MVSFLVFFIPKKSKHLFSLLTVLATVVVTSNWAISVLFFGNEIVGILPIKFLANPGSIAIDKLSAFFILVVNFTVFTGVIYAKGYLKSYFKTKNQHQFSIHYFSYLWLYFSMLLVLMVQDGLGFLIVWEIMSLSSFMLVIFDAEKLNILKTGLNYLVQMHVAFLFLLMGFITVALVTGEMSFPALADAFASNQLTKILGVHGNFWLFLIFFMGFGIKAGFIPLHTWLPHAHPAAPSHVSGVMSGVMIKMGIYGILRVVSVLQTDWIWVGVFILAISIVSGLFGVMMAIVQHDLKKLLAYHSIENIGIIGIGIGLGVIGVATQNNTLAILGFSGGLLHVLNHSLFKSILFYGAGSIYKSTHTRDLNSLGGLIKTMPKTAFLFLLGAMAISGLPPFNGFISEFLIYSGLFKSLPHADINFAIIFLSGIVGLALIGGLAIFCFTKVFGMVFLGTARTQPAADAKEVTTSMLIPQYLIGFLIVTIGLLPFLVLHPIQEVVSIFIPLNGEITNNTFNTLTNVSWASLVFIGLVAILWLIRKRQQKRAVVVHGPTWGCGYTAGDPALHQYTATSFADNFKQLAHPVVKSTTHYHKFKDDEIFPKARYFESHSSDKIENGIVKKIGYWSSHLMVKFAVLQTGKVQHYLIYPLVFIVVIFLLTYFQFI